jgi:hypothetical protein
MYSVNNFADVVWSKHNKFRYIRISVADQCDRHARTVLLQYTVNSFYEIVN